LERKARTGKGEMEERESGLKFEWLVTQFSPHLAKTLTDKHRKSNGLCVYMERFLTLNSRMYSDRIERLWQIRGRLGNHNCEDESPVEEVIKRSSALKVEKDRIACERQKW
jgi:hypothetical protein